MAECNDAKCAVHGSVKVRGNVFTGRVISAKAQNTAKVERELTQYVRKFERYKKIRSVIAVHNPACIGAKENDIVKVGETRKLSKTKSFVITEIEQKGTASIVKEETIPFATQTEKEIMEKEKKIEQKEKEQLKFEIEKKKIEVGEKEKSKFGKLEKEKVEVDVNKKEDLEEATK